MYQSKKRDTKNSPSSDAVFDQLLDEIGEKISRHEAVDLDSYSRKHPTLADRLRKAVMGLRLVAGMAPAWADDFDRELVSRQSLGDFRLIRQLGAGGMGVVYEAEQLSLGRRVALKVLPFAAVLDQRQLLRFQNEARAAATLDHPHIVSVYGVGQERGVYYYAMQLIEGQSLAEVIAHLRSEKNLYPAAARTLDGKCTESDTPGHSGPLVMPSCDTAKAALSTFISENEHDFFRRVAQIGAQAADALDHAHQQGIVHRDIKPANLLLDRLGRIYVADFGLARIDANPSLTMTGNVPGTIRYMSPEQALAKRDITDHHTDIYSLGATIYELLTLRPARDGEERHQILRQIEEEEPPRPRTLQPNIPVVLETILLKAMATHVADRYDTAAELAIDLRNFLDNKPIVGRRPSRLRRVGHWVAHHRLSATLLVAIFCVVSGLAIGGPIFAKRYSLIAHKEQITRHELERLLTETLTNATESLENSPLDPELHLPILDNTASQYETLLERVEDHDAQLLSDIAWGYYRLGRVIAFLVDQDRGESMVHRAQTIVTSLLAEQPTNPELQFRLATILAWQSIQAWSADFNHALELGWRGLRIMEQLVAQHPNSPLYESQLAECQIFLGLQLRQTSDSKELGSRFITDAYQTAVRLSDQFPRNSLYLVLRAVALSNLADLKTSDRNYQEALQLYRDYEQLRLRASPSVLAATRNRVGIGEAMLDMAKVLRKLGHEQEAESYLVKYAKDLGEVVRAYPNTDWARMTLSRLQWELADVLAAKGDLNSSLRALRDAASNSNIRNPWFQEALYMDLGNLSAFLGEEEEARRCYQFVVENKKQLDLTCWIHANATDERLRDLQRASELVEAASSETPRLRARSMGIVDYRRGDFAAARQHLADARRDETELDPVTWFFAAMVEHQLGNYELSVEYYTRAKQAISARKGLDFYHIWPIDLEAATLLGLETQSPFSNNMAAP